MLKGLLGSGWRRSEQDPLRAALGSLEREVMEIVWQGTEVTVRGVLASLSRPVAYTTAMTTLDRLYKKGLVARRQSGRAFVYSAAWSREQLEASMASGMLTGLLSHGACAAMPILSNLVEAVSREDGGLDLLDRLEELVRERRRRIQKDEA